MTMCRMQRDLCFVSCAQETFFRRQRWAASADVSRACHVISAITWVIVIAKQVAWDRDAASPIPLAPLLAGLLASLLPLVHSYSLR